MIATAEVYAAPHGWRVGVPAVRIAGDMDLSISKTFDCGQCFRFDPVPESPHFVEFAGVAHGRFISFAQDRAMSELILYNTDIAEFHDVWRPYLDLDTDYAPVRTAVGTALDRSDDPESVLHLAAEFGRGIRILRQDSWEALCSSILSQNNNIPRIKSIITALCCQYGDVIPDGAHAFPRAEQLLEAGEAALRALKVGFRAPYLMDAAQKWSAGEVSAKRVASAETLEDAVAELCRIKGVGPKVASCALLFGFSRSDAFPVDVWVSRSIARHFPNGLDPHIFGKYAGIAQQYLFYFERYMR